MMKPVRSFRLERVFRRGKLYSAMNEVQAAGDAVEDGDILSQRPPSRGGLLYTPYFTTF